MYELLGPPNNAWPDRPGGRLGGGGVERDPCRCRSCFAGRRRRSARENRWLQLLSDGLINALEDENDQIRQHAVVALATNRPQRASPATKKLYRRLGRFATANDHA